MPFHILSSGWKQLKFPTAHILSGTPEDGQNPQVLQSYLNVISSEGLRMDMPLTAHKYYIQLCRTMKSKWITTHVRSRHDLPGQAKKGGGGIVPDHSQPGARKMWIVSFRLQSLYPGKTRYPLDRRLNELRGRSGQHGKSCPHRDSIPRPSSP